jgi:biotin carboxylase
MRCLWQHFAIGFFDQGSKLHLLVLRLHTITYLEIFMPNLVVIGTNYFQIDLVEQAHKMGYETHMFGIAVHPKNPKDEWRRLLDLAGVEVTDVYYPVSILDTDRIIKRCQQIKPYGVISIGSDLAVPSMCQVATALKLTSNTPESALWCTNKYEMRKRFTKYDVPQPFWMYVDATFDPKVIDHLNLKYPLIVKAVDRSGKCGITKVNSPEEVMPAIHYGIKGSFASDRVLIEEFLEGKEYTCEALTYKGKHTILTWTEKWSDAPHFVEEIHLQPAPLSEDTIHRITPIIYKTLESLGITNGPSHTEFKFTPDGGIKIIEVAARVVADSIWSAVEITTGVNWIEKSIDIAVGKPLDLKDYRVTGDCGVIKFIIDKKDFDNFEWLQKNHREKIVRVSPQIEPFDGREVTTNGLRYGYYVMRCSSREEAIELTKVEQ